MLLSVYEKQFFKRLLCIPLSMFLDKPVCRDIVDNTIIVVMIT